MNIIGKCLQQEEFKKYVDDKFFGFFPANKIVLHHTYIPTLAQWRGKDTIYGLQKYYENKGWSAGPHLYIADDGIWLFTDMRKNGIHAGSGNYRSIGIEMVGDYQRTRPNGILWDNVLFAITILNKKLGLKPENIKFHRDYSATDCPGLAVEKNWVVNEIKNFRIIPDYLLIKSRTKSTVYFVRNNIKYPISDWDSFMFYFGNRQKDVVTLEDNIINQIKTGNILPSVKNLI